MERIGIFGGSFNPPHVGHIRAIDEVSQLLLLDRVLIIPAGTVPSKKVPMSSPEHRLAMTRLAAAGNPRMTVSDMEIDSSGNSYTYKTVLRIRKQFPEAELFLLVGADKLCSLPQWVQVEQIIRNVTVVVLPRDEKKYCKEIEKGTAALKQLGASVIFADFPPCEISSTQIRRLLAFDCASEFLESSVLQYIHQNRLYHTGENWKNLPMDRLEQVAVELLDSKRVQHVLGCRDTAATLARHWGANDTDAARAGVLHDITKALDGPLQLTLCRAYGTMLDDFSQKYPKTLHALTGSLVAREVFGENAAVVSAIRYHTTGKADMNLLEAILYVADYMEPNRNFDGVDQLRHLAYTDIYAALRLGLEMTLKYLGEQGSEVSPESQKALDWLKQ